jgi:formylglycine-generating enzyme required for sulfatase activity
MTSKSIEGRPATMVEVLAHLEGVATRVTPIRSADERKAAPKGASASHGSRRWLLVFAVVGMAVIATLGGLIVKQRMTKEAVAVHNAAVAMQQAIVTAGLEDTALSKAAAEALARGKSQWANGKRGAARKDFQRALSGFRQVLATDVEQVLHDAELLRVAAPPELAERAAELHSALASDEPFGDASRKEQQLLALRDLRHALQTAPRKFLMGSTSSELDAAVQLCAASMGDACQRSWYEDEAAREVTLEPFEIDAQPVTSEEFAKFVAATGHRTSAEVAGYGYRLKEAAGMTRVPGANWRTHAATGASAASANQPVVYVSLDDARAYCRWASRRLPDEAEWEYAARGPERRIFPWGNEWRPEEAARSRDGYLMGDIGKVWEFVETLATDKRPVLRGGSSAERIPSNTRLAVRRFATADAASEDDGFRCAMNADQWPAVKGAIPAGA